MPWFRLVAHLFPPTLDPDPPPMALLSLIVALLLEQFRPIDPGGGVFAMFARYTDAIGRNFNAGKRKHGVIGWLLAVVPIVLLANLAFYALHELNLLLAWAWTIGVLYLTMGFRQFSHAFSAVLEALRAGRFDDARALLSPWRNEPADELTQSEIAKVSIEQGLVGAHGHVFGVIAWFVFLPAVFGSLLPGTLGTLLSGPGGALLYRLSTVLSERWGRQGGDAFAAFGSFAIDAFRLLDWVPTRLTALSFAIVGDFEDAVYCWRSQAAGWLDPQAGIILASGAGAIGVRLGDTLHANGTVTFRPELGLGDEADLEHMQSAVGLIWRALVLWLLLIGLMTVANWVG